MKSLDSLSEKGFHVMLWSSPFHDNLVAEIQFKGKYIALVQQDRGSRNFDVETPGLDLVESTVARKFEFDGFIEALQAARTALSEGAPT